MINTSERFNSIPNNLVEVKKTKFLFFNKTYTQSINLYDFKGASKSLQLFENKPFQFRFSQWLWGANHIAVPVKDKTEPLFISVSELSEATGVQRSVLQEINPKAIAQLIHVNKHFINGKWNKPVNNTLKKVITAVNEQRNTEVVESYNKLSSFLKFNTNLAKLISPEDLEAIREMRFIEGNTSLFSTIKKHPSFKDLMLKLSDKFENKILSKLTNNTIILNAFLDLSLTDQDKLLQILEKPKNLNCLENLNKLIKNKIDLSWKIILKSPEFIKLFKNINSQLKLKSYTYILENENAQKLMSMQSDKQNNSLIDQFNKNADFTMQFIENLILWKEKRINEPFKLISSKNLVFDEKLEELSKFLQQEEISHETSSQILLAFLCNPETDLTLLFSLLKIIKEAKHEVKISNIFHLLNSNSASIKDKAKDSNFLELLKNNAVNADMLFRALKKVDNTLRHGTFFEKKKIGKHYGFAIDKNQHFFIRVYQIGRGTFKKVSKTVSDIANVVVITFTTKTVDKEPNECNPKKELEAEQAILNLKLPNAMPPFVSTFVPEIFGKVFAVQTEMKADGSSLIKGSPHQILYAITDVVRALDALHDTGKFHADFKPGNFLLKGDVTSKTTPVIASLHDFGLVTRIGDPNLSGGQASKPPEIIGTAKTDSFAVGVSLINMLLGFYRLPNTYFRNFSQKDLDVYIPEQFNKLDQSRFSEEEKKIASDLIDVTKKLMKIDIKQRLSCKDALRELEGLKKKYPFPVTKVI